MLAEPAVPKVLPTSNIQHLTSNIHIMASMKITRRTLAISALAGAASAAQQTTTDELEQARKQVELTSQALLKFEVAMSVEPAFQFKA
jgi:hypothetical protein